MMGKLALVLVLGASAFAGAAAAQQIECGATYTVARGDTLSRIARRAYGEIDFYRLIYEANRQAIGRDPARMEVGTVLRIPCLDETGAPIDARLPEIPPAAPGVIRFVTGPRSDGPVAAILRKTMEGVSLSDSGYDIVAIDAWGADPLPLVSGGDFDFGFPVLRPECGADELAPPGRRICDAFDWSAPFREQVIGIYGRAGDPVPPSRAALAGLTVCALLGLAAFVPEGATIRPANDTGACLDALSAGEAELAVLTADEAEQLLAPQDAESRIVRHAALDLPVTLHVVTSKDNLRGAEYLALIDAELRTLKADGTWFSILRQSRLAEVTSASGR